MAHDNGKDTTDDYQKADPQGNTGSAPIHSLTYWLDEVTE
jgi:hypothetical protein